ncbi:Shedu immune nuclease family protein [Acinetobacter haemolyticus]|uniref:Shedu immune nuclease family protein n=1 Tax=Acinetobacter haemolyticus TaxID=29430 RepID=UPI00300864F5
MDDYQNPKEGKTYISPRLDAFGDSDRKVRIASKVIESPDSYAFAKIQDEVVLRHKEGAKSHITAKFLEDNRGIFVLSIQGYTIATEKPRNASFSFVGDEIDKLLEFIRNIQSVNLDNPSRVNISDEELNRIVLNDKQAKSLFHENQELFAEVLKSEITTEDLIAVGYRKKQLDVYKKLLADQSYFESIKSKKNTTNEGLWQKYFEKNPWVFGYGLGYIFLSTLDDKKLEQVVQGHSVDSHGKRVDALMKTKGVISNLCFVEIKTHITELLESKPYRSGCWAPSKELAGAIAQVQGTVSSAVESLSSKINPSDSQGNPTGEEIFNYQPKSYLVIGSMSEFVSENGVNIDKIRSFELLRKNTTNPEIITFDELYERARFIVHHNQS